MSLDRTKNDDWNWIKAKDFMIFNPRESVKKGTTVKNVPMDKIEPKTKEILNYEVTEYNSGVKFRNGDTLMARITPCLENGKISQVSILDYNEIGTGSTEFIVLREKEGISDKDFIYYLSNSEFFKEPAIKSMVGSSGRQRVQRDVVENLEIYVPPLDTQKKIGKLLSYFDDKISLNKKINNHLEELSSKLVIHIFNDNNGESVELKEICKFIKGRKPAKISEFKENNFLNYLTIDVLSNQNDSYAFDEKGIKVDEYDILMVMDGASSGKLFYGKKGLVGSTLAKLEVNNEYQEIVYQFLKINEQFICENTTGTAIPHTDKGLVLNLQCPISKEIFDYSKIFRTIRTTIIANNNEINKLKRLRDILLPKLMSGEIDVSKLNYDLE